MDIEFKTFPFAVSETKESEREGVKYGYFKGYASTYGNVDRGNDVVLPGAFTKSIDKLKESGRPIRMYHMHDGQELIGGFPIHLVRDDEKGLWVEGEINLETQRGREDYALAKQGVLSDLSIGYGVDAHDWDGDVRQLKELTLWEVSMVAEPMNPEASIMSVKAVGAVGTLPIAPEDHKWDADAAVQRVRKFTNSTEEPSARYKRAFMYYDGDKPEDFGSYKLPYADIVNGQMMAVPRAIFAVAAALDGSRGGVDIPASEKKRIATVVNRYYKRMDKESPLEKSSEEVIEKKLFNVEDVDHIFTQRDLEHFLRDSGMLTKKASVLISGRFESKSERRDSADDKEEALNSDNDFEELKSSLLTLKKSFNHKR